ncbi:MAG: dTDP-4-dehydrorhamnose 3,5-epimerase family protein [Flavobacteriales bacterium]|nr:dTDP-4-dehydrorhamnose 3,5-epimerase family protein [Flavobacteriales bacterium]
MVSDVIVRALKVISDDRGEVKHMLKATDDAFTKFGEIYFSSVLPGKIKAWHKNKTTTVNYAVVSGNIKLVVYDGENSREIFIGEDNHQLVTIPPNVWRGFTAVGDQKAIVADLTDAPYNPDDLERADADALIDCW